MKKLLLLLTICCAFVSSSVAQEIGVTMTTIQNVYVGSLNTYSVGASDDYTYAWEVYTNEACDFLANAEASFTGDVKNTASIGITWNGPGTLSEDKNYYLKLTKTRNDHSCVNYKILHVVLKATNDMDVLFASASSKECSVSLSGDNVKVPVALSGSGLVHEDGKLVSVWYTVNSANESDAVELAVSTTKENGSYFITIPNAKLIDLNPEEEQNYVIRLFKAKNGSGTVKDLDETTHKHTRTSYALPVIEDIQF